MLAGRRSADDPLAKAAGASHRALLEIEGEPMLARVVARLLTWPSVEQVFINIDEPALLDGIESLDAARATGAVEVIKSAASPSRSVLESLEHAKLGSGPVLVTTADHALLDDAILRNFFRASLETDADLNVALVPRAIIQAQYPETKRTYLQFKDDGYSGANLFFFRSPASKRAADFWRRVENDRKKPWRLARAFGLSTLILFVMRRLTLAAAMDRASRVIGIKIAAIAIPIAEAAVDVDKIEDLELVRAILAKREALADKA